MAALDIEGKYGVTVQISSSSLSIHHYNHINFYVDQLIQLRLVLSIGMIRLPHLSNWVEPRSKCRGKDNGKSTTEPQTSKLIELVSLKNEFHRTKSIRIDKSVNIDKYFKVSLMLTFAILLATLANDYTTTCSFYLTCVINFYTSLFTFLFIQTKSFCRRIHCTAKNVFFIISQCASGEIYLIFDYSKILFIF